MNKNIELDLLFAELGLSDNKWIKAEDITVSNWVRVKCTFGCPDYGSSHCPPNVPGVNDCKDFFNEYSSAVIFRFNLLADKDNYPNEYSIEITRKLLMVEREVFLKGFQKAFVFNPTCCGLCSGCVKTRIDCKNLAKGRPSPEAFAMDVFSTVRKVGFEIDVIKSSRQQINRYAILMID